jgi:allophanate hydrolase
VPARDQLQFFGDHAAAKGFDHAVEALERLGGQKVEVDFAPFEAAARLLYEGPWVAERYLAIREFVDRRPSPLLAVTHEIIAGGARHSAADGFAAQYRLQQLIRAVEPTWQRIDTLVVPTAGTIYTTAEIDADPIGLNTNLGYYTNFLNLMDLGAIAVPAGFLPNGLPFGITIIAPAFRERALCVYGDAAQRALVATLGATGHALPPPRPADSRNGAGATVRLAVCGAHMSGLPLNWQLTDRGATLVRRCKTAPHYRLFALDGFTPPRPGMIRAKPGHAIEVEVWEVPSQAFGSFVDGIPPPLGIGTVELEDGEQLRGFVCETYATATATDISELGSWRKFVSAATDKARA